MKMIALYITRIQQCSAPFKTSNSAAKERTKPSVESILIAEHIHGTIHYSICEENRSHQERI